MLSNVFSSWNELVIDTVSLLNKGTYTCEGRTKNGSFFYAESKLQVIG